MRPFHRSLLFMAILSMSAGLVWGSSQAEDDPGMADGYRRMQESDARYRFEHETRKQNGKGSILERIAKQDARNHTTQQSGKQSGGGSILDEAAENDTVTGLIGEGIEKLATKVLGKVGGKILGNLPVDDVAKVAGRMAEGDTEGAAEAYATGWVGFLSGTIASVCVKGALAGTAVAVSAPTLTAVGVVGVGIGVAYLAKKGFEYLLSMGKSNASRRPTRVRISKDMLSANVRLTDQQLKSLKSTLKGLNLPAPQPGTLPPASHTAAITIPEIPVAIAPPPVIAIPEIPVPVALPPVPVPQTVPPANPATNPPADVGQAANAEPANTGTTKAGTGTTVSEPGTTPVGSSEAAAVPAPSTTRPTTQKKSKPPVRTVPANQTCPSCGVRTTTYNTPLCTSCSARIALDRAMQRAAEAKGQKRKPRESQYWQYLPK